MPCVTWFEFRSWRHANGGGMPTAFGFHRYTLAQWSWISLHWPLYLWHGLHPMYLKWKMVSHEFQTSFGIHRSLTRYWIWLGIDQALKWWLVAAWSSLRVSLLDTSCIPMALLMVCEDDDVGCTWVLNHVGGGWACIGSGSQQQSITAFPEDDDSNSYWIVRAAVGKQCKRG